MNARASGSVSQMSTPTPVMPRPRFASHVRASSGASSRQGTHHDAQKLTTTPLPRSSANPSVPPSNSASSNRGAATRCSGRDSALDPSSPTSVENRSPTAKEWRPSVLSSPPRRATQDHYPQRHPLQPAQDPQYSR